MISEVLNQNNSIVDLLRNDIIAIKGLFDIQESEDYSSFLENFSKYITDSKQSWQYLLELLNHFITCRLKFEQVHLMLFHCIENAFPEEQAQIKKYLNYLSNVRMALSPDHGWFITSNLIELLQYISHDDIDNVIELLSEKGQALLYEEFDDYDECPYSNLYYKYHDSHLPLLVSCYCGSIKCFKYFILNHLEITGSHVQAAVEGGNKEIINILKERDYSFQNCLKNSIIYHRYELADWILTNYDPSPMNLARCINCFNFEAFIYFLQHGESIEEYDCDGYNALHSACSIVYFPLVKYLIEDLHSSIDRKIPGEENALFIASERGSLQIVKYLVEKGIENQPKYSTSPADIAWRRGHYDVAEYLFEETHQTFSLWKLRLWLGARKVLSFIIP